MSENIPMITMDPNIVICCRMNHSMEAHYQVNSTTGVRYIMCPRLASRVGGGRCRENRMRMASCRGVGVGGDTKVQNMTLKDESLKKKITSFLSYKRNTRLLLHYFAS